MRGFMFVCVVLFTPAFAKSQTIESASGDAHQMLDKSSLVKADHAQEVEAAGLLQGKTDGGRIPDSQLRSVVQELAAIRLISPETQAIKPFAGSNFDELTMDVSPSLAVKLGRRLPKKDHATTLSCSVGSSELNQVLTSLPCKSIKVESYGDSYSMTMHFSRPIDLEAAQHRLGDVGLESNSGGLVRIGSPSQSIHRFEKNGESLYALGAAGPYADCMAGCMQNYLYFRISWGPNGPEAHLVTPSRPGMSVYGYPERFPAQPFHDYADLSASLSDPDWSIRYHAVNTIKKILRHGSTGLREDDYPEDDAEKNRIKAIFNAVISNREALEHRLEAIASQDQDPDVRRAAAH